MKLVHCKIPNGFFKNPIHLIASGFGVGLSPIMPGTCGTLIIGIPVYLLLSHLSLISYLAITILLTLICFWLCDKTARNLKQNDPQCIVLDEVIGLLCTMIGAPNNITSLIIGFLLFRIFDILKPWPISWLDREIHGGIGIVLDDIAAGTVAAVFLQLIKYF